MSQGTTGSTKLMLIVWAIAMIFIGFKAYYGTLMNCSNLKYGGLPLRQLPI